MAEGADVRLARMRRALVRLRAAGREREFAAVAAAYGSLKAQEMERVELEQREAVRARRAQQRAVEAPSGVWKLPAGFQSPLAAERARSGAYPAEEPRHPGYGLSPWRRSWSPASAVIWRR